MGVFLPNSDLYRDPIEGGEDGWCTLLAPVCETLHLHPPGCSQLDPRLLYHPHILLCGWWTNDHYRGVSVLSPVAIQCSGRWWRIYCCPHAKPEISLIESPVSSCTKVSLGQKGPVWCWGIIVLTAELKSTNMWMCVFFLSWLKWSNMVSSVRRFGL